MNTKYYISNNLNNVNLSNEEVLDLFRFPLPVLGKIADEIRKERCGDLVSFVIDRNINYTNKCVSRCKFCAFYNDNGYVLSKEDIINKVEEAVSLNATQIMLQGGLNPDLKIEWFEDIFREIKKRFDVQTHSLSPPEIYYLSKIEKMTVKEVLKRLKNSGLDSLPGGGAEILSNRVRKIISPNKVDSDNWIDVMRVAHSLGMRTTATMMFGHVEQDEDIVEHLLRIRDLQSETNGFTAFIPWTFQSEKTELYDLIERKKASTVRYLQVIAISRIVLHNIPNIQASWLTQGLDIASLALSFGANDFGSTMLEENVVRATGKEFMPARVEDIVKAVKSVGRRVALRRTDYSIIKEY